MLNHITLFVKDFKKSKEFYIKALEPLGYKLLDINPNCYKEQSAGYGTRNIDGYRDFWIKENQEQNGNSLSCLAFTASDKGMVDAFYKAALEAGGKDNGAPGYHTEYSPGYYGAFVFDPDGNNIEAVFDDPHQMI